ncbi:hypothetical protein R1flu_009725 [Riccia fluitans]|uniref:Uncharacterized protein n=1 Tax=Riccia fluitans TaxID=41844 RepID=A0ABD1Z3R1_9MARC
MELPTRYFGPLDPCVYWPGSPLLYDNVEDLVRAKGPISHVKTLIKYNMKHDSWTAATQQYPCEELCGLHLASFENRLFMVNFGDSVNCSLFPPEFSSLVPEMENFDAEDVALLFKQVGDTKLSPGDPKPKKAIAEGGSWFVITESSTGLTTSLERSVEIFAFSKSPPTVRRLPGLDMSRKSIGSFAYVTPSLKAVP